MNNEKEENRRAFQVDDKLTKLAEDVGEILRSPALPEEMIKKSSEDGFMTSPRIPEIVDCCNQIIRYLKARE